MTINLSGNQQTTIISCYSPTNVSDEQETIEFYTELNSLTRRIPKHNVLIIGGDFNAKLGQTDGFKYSYHKITNRNGKMLKNYLEENNLLCLNTKFKKRLGQIWTHNSLNDYKSKIDILFINKKWKNSIINCRAYNSFISIASDHRILSTKIKLSLKANKKKCSKNKPYD